MSKVEEMRKRLEESNKEVMAQINGTDYDPSWRKRKTASGKNYNDGKYDTPYAEDNIKKALIFAFFCGIFLLGAMQ